MRFAARTEFGEGESAYGMALRQARAAGGLIDLTLSNPTSCGFHYAPDVLTALSDPAALTYDASAAGTATARAAVAALYRERYGADVSAERILLTASTSEAYGYLLRLLCDPGDNILVPSPSYPLFDLLAQLHDVQLVPYPLVYHDGWQIDPASLAAAVTPRTRALVAVHPNNPTGHYCSKADRAALFEVAARHGVPLIVDEVFLDYPVEDLPQRSFAADQVPVPTFVMGGLSKLAALPGMKVAWTAVCGAGPDVPRAMDRLEVIADTFLSLAAPQQHALPHWLSLSTGQSSQVQERIQTNLAVLDRLLTGTMVTRLRVGGGWSAILRVPALEHDEDAALRLLALGVATHPGSLYGLPSRGWLVVSLLPETVRFAQGIARLLQAF